MGRKSALTDEQWLDVERRHVVDGESINSIATDLGINESSIRRKLKPNKAESPNSDNPLKTLAKEKIRVDSESRQIAEQIAALPFAKQQMVSDLARKLTNISDHMASAAEISAASAHRLAILANQQLEKVDEVNPEKTAGAVQAAALFQKMSNSAGETPVNMMRANKEAVELLSRPAGAGARSIAVSFEE